MITILLVDHSLDFDPGVHNLLLALPTDQFQIKCVKGYRAILEAFRRQTGDVCVIDSNRGSGLKLLAQACSIGFSVPIVMITANDASEAAAAMRNGAADCLIRDEQTSASIERSLCCAVEQARSAALQLQRERRYLALLDNVNEIIYTHDLDNKITSINAAGLHLLGYSLPEMLGQKVSAIVAAASQPLVSRTIDLLLDAQKRTRSEVKFMTKAGVTLPVEMNAHPIYLQGKPIEVQVLARLITEPLAPHTNRYDEAVYSSPATHYRLPEAWPEVRAS